MEDLRTFTDEIQPDLGCRAIPRQIDGEFVIDAYLPESQLQDDYAFSRHFADSSKTKIYGFTVECGKDFHPAWTEAEAIILEVSAGLIAFCLEISA